MLEYELISIKIRRVLLHTNDDEAKALHANVGYVVELFEEILAVSGLNHSGDGEAVELTSHLTVYPVRIIFVAFCSTASDEWSISCKLFYQQL